MSPTHGVCTVPLAVSTSRVANLFFRYEKTGKEFCSEHMLQCKIRVCCVARLFCVLLEWGLIIRWGDKGQGSSCGEKLSVERICSKVAKGNGEWSAIPYYIVPCCTMPYCTVPRCILLCRGCRRGKGERGKGNGERGEGGRFFL